MLRREGYAGPVTMLSAENERPYDRPNRSTDYLAGDAPEEWLPLRPPEFYVEHQIALTLGARTVAIDPNARAVQLADGARHPWGALLLGTGPEPIRLGIPGAELPHVHTLRSASDCRALIGGAQVAWRAVVIGVSFIGLEVAASLRTRGLGVDVMAPEARPMEAVFGAEIGDLVRRVHEQHGVRFHVGTTAAVIDPRGVDLHSGERLDTDIVVVGIGVRPRTAPADSAGIAVDRGITVDAYLKPAFPASREPATSPVGPTGSAAGRYTSSIGALPSVRARWRPAICWAGAKGLTQFRSFGRSSTI
jgi:apoptosis-inducing factor 3